MSIHGPKPYKFTGFGNIHGPKPYKFIGFGDLHGPKPYKFIGFGDLMHYKNGNHATAAGGRAPRAGQGTCQTPERLLASRDAAWDGGEGEGTTSPPLTGWLFLSGSLATRYSDFSNFRPIVGQTWPQNLLERRGSSCSAGCSKNQPADQF